MDDEIMVNDGIDYDIEFEYQGDEDFLLLDEGDYNFVVREFERSVFPGSKKPGAKIVNPCGKITLNIVIYADQGMARLKQDLLIHQSCAWKISQFFGSILKLQKGQKVRPDWNAVVGAQGHCHVIQEGYVNKDGENRKKNVITKFYPYDEKNFSKVIGEGFKNIDDPFMNSPF